MNCTYWTFPEEASIGWLMGVEDGTAVDRFITRAVDRGSLLQQVRGMWQD